MATQRLLSCNFKLSPAAQPRYSSMYGVRVETQFQRPRIDPRRTSGRAGLLCNCSLPRGNPNRRPPCLRTFAATAQCASYWQWLHNKTCNEVNRLWATLAAKVGLGKNLPRSAAPPIFCLLSPEVRRPTSGAPAHMSKYDPEYPCERRTNRTKSSRQRVSTPVSGAFRGFQGSEDLAITFGRSDEGNRWPGQGQTKEIYMRTFIALLRKEFVPRAPSWSQEFVCNGIIKKDLSS